MHYIKTGVDYEEGAASAGFSPGGPGGLADPPKNPNRLDFILENRLQGESKPSGSRPQMCLSDTSRGSFVDLLLQLPILVFLHRLLQFFPMFRQILHLRFILLLCMFPLKIDQSFRR